MGRKRFTAEQIIHMLRQAEVEIAKGKSVPEACKQIGIVEQTYSDPVELKAAREVCGECVEAVVGASHATATSTPHSENRPDVLPCRS